MSALALSLLALTGQGAATLSQGDFDYKDGDLAFEGYYAAPAKAATKPTAAVIVIQDWNGIDNYEKTRCRMLAEELGVVAFAIDIYGKGVRPTNPQASGAESRKYYADPALLARRMSVGLQQLGKLPVKVDAAHVGAIGYCFGGKAVLEMARFGMPVKSVVCFHGNLGTNAPAQKGKVSAQVMVLNGDADPVVPVKERETFKEEMKSAGVPLVFIDYPEAKHAFTVFGGGNYQEKADKESWVEMSKFLKKTLSL